MLLEWFYYRVSNVIRVSFDFTSLHLVFGLKNRAIVVYFLTRLKVKPNSIVTQ